MSMGQDDLILVIGRIERALNRLETNMAQAPANGDASAVHEDYEKLRSAAQQAIRRIDAITNAEGGANA